MASYATLDDLQEAALGNPEVEPINTEFAEVVLERASHDIDYLLGFPPPVTDSLRIDLTELDGFQRAALARATALQACYRLQRGEAEFIVDQDGIAGVEGISFASQPPPRIGPAAREAIADAGLFRRSALVPPVIEVVEE